MRLPLSLAASRCVAWGTRSFPCSNRFRPSPAYSGRWVQHGNPPDFRFLFSVIHTDNNSEFSVPYAITFAPTGIPYTGIFRCKPVTSYHSLISNASANS